MLESKNKFNRLFISTMLGLLLTLIFGGANAIVNKLVGIPFLPYLLFDWLVTVLDGRLVTFGLDTTVSIVRALNIGATYSVAKTAERILGLTLFALLMAVVSAAWSKITTQNRAWLASLILFLPTFALLVWFGQSLVLGSLWFALSWLMWSVYLVRWLNIAQNLPPNFYAEGYDAGTLMTRRIFLGNMGARLLGLGVGAVAIRYALNAVIIDNALAGANLVRDKWAAFFPPRETSDFVPIDGTRPELTPSLYVIDKNLIPPNVDGQEWRLKVKGQSELTLTYDDILAMDTLEMTGTLSCISNPVGGDLIGTVVWAGFRLADLLERVGIGEDTVEIQFKCADGYYESIPLKTAMLSETLLCYAMNGQALTVRHGFPLRLYTPARFGMKNPKWIHTIQTIAAPENGYWTNRSWTKDGLVKTTSVIDVIQEGENDTLLVGGMAYAADRGISRVEVRIGNTGDWIPAEFGEALSPFTWVLWRAEVPNGDKVTVRCVDGAGQVQASEVRDIRPDGASGYHSQRT